MTQLRRIARSISNKMRYSDDDMYIIIIKKLTFKWQPH